MQHVDYQVGKLYSLTIPYFDEVWTFQVVEKYHDPKHNLDMVRVVSLPHFSTNGRHGYSRTPCLQLDLWRAEEVVGLAETPCLDCGFLCSQACCTD